MTQRKKILVVDCDADLLIALERVLQEQGFDTTTTWDVRQANTLLESDGYDLVLLGEHPPEMSFTAIAKALWSKRRSIPCIVLHCSRHYPLNGTEHLHSLGARAVVSKWNLKEIVDKVHYCIHLSNGMVQAA